MDGVGGNRSLIFAHVAIPVMQFEALNCASCTDIALDDDGIRQ